MCESSWEEDTKDLHKYILYLHELMTQMTWKTVKKFSDALTAACNKSFKRGRAFLKTRKHKTVPWWTGTNNSEETSKCIQKEIPKDKQRQLRDRRQTKYQGEKARHQAK
jgi:hypothetical protein